MAHDERYPGRSREYREERGGWGERETRWRGDPAFGGGWGNQVPRIPRPGERGWRGPDEPYGDAERYGPGASAGYAGWDDYGPSAVDSDISLGGPGYDAGYGTPRFDRIDVGRAGGHGADALSSPSGRASRFSPAYGSSARTDAIRRHDPHYAEWRRQQIDALDRDYEEYRRENQSHFDREFGAWRTRRGAQREAVGRVAEHMEVVGSDGAHVGKVDKVRGDTLILARNDPSAGGVHHAIPCGWIDRVDDKVTLNITAEDTMERWRTETRSRALFERDRRDDGPHILNRSFSGTYSDDE